MPSLSLDAIELLVRVLLALLVFAVVWLSRNLLRHLIARPIQQLAGQRSASLEVTINRIFTGPVRLLALALAIDLSARVLEPGPDIQLFVFRTTRTLLIVAIASGVYNVVRMIATTRNRFLTFTGVAVDEALLPFVRTGLQFLAVAIALTVIITIWGYDVTGLVAGLGLGGLAFSLAAQDTLANLFGFSMIVGDRPFVVGEFIKTPDVEGVVERVGLRSTRVRQLNQAIVTVPNSTLANSTILNWSRLSKRWIDFTLRIDYRARPEQIERLMDRLRSLLRERDDVQADSIVIQFINFGENSLEILVRAYVLKANWLEFTQTREAVNLAIMRIVREMGLNFAYPSRTLYIDKLPDLTDSLRELADSQHEGNGTQGGHAGDIHS